ncbi:MAG: patatin-like phospholipase family protein [Gemmatimonadetes bacterium]|nr:patatin-like phospholipase family protein [Gemmatimonadota bacterium]
MSEPTGPTDLALVLSGGGARASYQVGVIAALAERVPDLAIPIITGVSAGAINAAFIAGHPGPLSRAITELRGHWLRLNPETVYRFKTMRLARWSMRLLTQFALRRMEGLRTVRGVMDMRPLTRFLAEIINFPGIEANVLSGRLRAVALTTTSYTTGQTVTFVQGVQDIRVWERVQRAALYTRLSLAHVMASSAIPLIFPAVRIGDSFYGDGSVSQTAPLSPAVHLGARRILAVGMRSKHTTRILSPDAEYPTTAQVMALLFNAVFLDAIDSDAERLERMNRLLSLLSPGQSPPDGLRPVDFIMLRPTRDLGTLAEGMRLNLPPTFERVVQSMGGKGEGAQDFLSYLLFDPEYTGLLMELGYEDTLAAWDRIERFLNGGD